MENFIVTFARGFGTGGKEIASMLAKDLGIHCYENRILTLASQMSGLDEKLFLDINERIRNNGGFTGFLKGLPRSRQYIARNEKFVSDDRLFEYQSQIIRNLADQESCVIVGRCVNYVFKDRPNTLRVFVHAPWEFRVEKSREKISGSDEEIEKFLRRDDKRKQDYYRKFAGGDWSDATNYDLCLNAGKLGFEKCVDAILAQMNVMGIK